MQTVVPSNKELCVAYSKESKDGKKAVRNTVKETQCVPLLSKPA